MPPKVLYFDIGHVLLSFSHQVMCDQMAAVAGLTSEAVRDLIFGDEDARAAEWRYECGLMTTDEFFDFFCRATNTRPDRRALAEAVSDIFAPIDETWQLVRRLANEGRRLAMLSNTNPVQYESISDGRFPVLANVGQPGSVFSWAVLSFEVKAMKPDAKIYEAAIQRAGVPAEEVFFVDDRPENVAGARVVGIDAVQFYSIEQLTDDLSKRGITA